MISNPKNLYGRILDAQSAKVAKTPLLGVVLDNLRVKYKLFMKKNSKFLISDPKNLYGRILEVESAKIAKTPLSGVVLANLRVKS